MGRWLTRRKRAQSAREAARRPPAQFEQTKDALLGIGVDSMTLAEVKHLDRTTRRREVFRGSAYVVDYVLRVRLDLVVQDPIVPRILDVLAAPLTERPPPHANART